MEEPSPMAITPPILQSLYPVAEKPTICAQQPTAAAPAANPDKFNIIHSAVLERGDVKTSPTITDTIIPIKKGCSSVAFIIITPIPLVKSFTAGPIKVAVNPPAKSVTPGVTRISTFVSLDTAFPNSDPTIVETSAAASPPILAPNAPVTALVNITSGGAFNAHATAIPIDAPTCFMAKLPNSTR